jgi:hypothetical protein
MMDTSDASSLFTIKTSIESDGLCQCHDALGWKQRRKISDTPLATLYSSRDASKVLHMHHASKLSYASVANLCRTKKREGCKKVEFG